MPDIIVTTPKTRMKQAALEAENCKQTIDEGGEAWYFRKLGSAKVDPGDRVYYVEDGWVRGFAVVAAVEDSRTGKMCATTGRRFTPGRYAIMDARSWQWVRPLAMRGFQGYRYADKYLPAVPDVVGGWLDPKPEVAL